jgi:flagellar motor protein MotB
MLSDQNPWMGGQAQNASLYQRLPNGQVQYATQQQGEQIAQLSKQMTEMSQQLSRFDTDNQGLHGQVASLQQKLDAANNFNHQLKQQLRDATVQLQQQANSQATGLAAQSAGNASGPYQFAGTATIRANNSLMGKLSQLEAAGVKASMDGDVIRIEFPSDQVFVPNTYQIQPTQQVHFNNLANIIRQQFPEQFIGIEAHWDQSAVQGSSTSLQQLTATQSLAVLNSLAQAGVAGQQMFTVGMGSNRPRYPNNAPQNRRVEVVIYPESYRSNQ